uniref:Histone deacetylase complex subunit SAP30 zinc-finger domain-containing protein n=1 Tax=Tetranychus urticae TaxID=32264 RepID=T1KPK6_TETUR
MFDISFNRAKGWDKRVNWFRLRVNPGSAFSSSFSLSSNIHQLCCLTEDGSRCNRVAGNASYSKRIQKTAQQKKLRLSIDNTARHVYICDHHKNMIQSVRSCVKRKEKTLVKMRMEPTPTTVTLLLIDT